METAISILWRGLFFAGHESCRLRSAGDEWHLDGTAVFSHEQRPCCLSYHIVCDGTWRTHSTQVEGWLGGESIDLHIRTDLDGHWWMNEVEQPQVAGCTDIDLNFSPSTNLLPIRRLGLGVGETGEVNAAWLRFPSFKLERLSQQYRRLDENLYSYESAGGQFVAELKVNSSGFVIEYPNLWQAEASAE
ncbi:MAG TPA: putative glycolipid-binding domain-containing protein [Anaerolineales bacterium]|jgi:hypothetical protein|nr:putative glycolipid-binding domain-containing protein [Anaerolineales bacterium]